MKSLKKTARRGTAQAVFAALEALEPRQMMSTFVVTNTRDSGGGSLRQAMLNANNHAGADTILFNVFGTPGVKTISPKTALPTITEQVFIDGFSQTGASVNTAAMDEPINAVYKIQINGSHAGDNAAGIIIDGANSSVITGLVINNFAYGVAIQSGSFNTVKGNFLGTNVTGTAAPTPLTGSGVFNYYHASFTTIGGENPEDRNLISGNSVGITSGRPDTQIQGNFIGTDATGMRAISNVIGIDMNSALGSTIGGNSLPARNLISGNTDTGLVIENYTSQDMTVQGNLFGTNRTGVAASGLSNGVGILIKGQYSGGPHDNLIGGLGEGEGNVITNSVGAGIALIGSTGLTQSGHTEYPFRIEISGNSIYGNGGLGIDIDNDGVTANDYLDDDGGPNVTQNAPVITSALLGGHLIEGTLNSTPYSNFRIEVYVSSTPRSGRTLLGTVDVFTDSDGDATFELTSPYSVTAGQVYTAVAINGPYGQGYGDDGNTSEFSAGFTNAPTDEQPYVLPNDVNVQVVNGKLQIVGGSAGNKLEITVVPPKKGETLAQFIISGLGPTTVNGQRSVTISATGIASIIMGNFNDEISITSKGKRFSLDGAIIETKLGEDVLSLNNVEVIGGKIKMGGGRDSLLLKKSIVSATTEFDFRRTQSDTVFAKNSKINLSQVFIPE